MAIAFYCEDEDPKLFQGYYTAFGYPSYQQQQQQLQQHSVTIIDNQQSQTAGLTTSVDENNNNTDHCALHNENDSNNVQTNGFSSGSVSAVDSSRQLMHILHQVLYRYTMEGALGPAHTSCAFCNKIYYLFQLLY